MKTTDNVKNYGLRREDTMFDTLTSSKRRYIETWRQSVSAFMETGNICKVTIGDVTPEPTSETRITSDTRWSHSDHSRSPAETSSRQEMASPSLPAVKFSYSHVPDHVTRQYRRDKAPVTRDRTFSLTSLPPSPPNGFAVQNGTDLHQAYKRRTSAMRAATSNITSELPDVTRDGKDVTRKSSMLAREIYEKYNLKNKSQNLLSVGKSNPNGIEQFSMPWRNKTFLTLPLRFNGTAQQKPSIIREKTNITEMRYNINDLENNDEWDDVRNW
ncbi:uncharacterized protein LOC127880987 [Dreissena polymorpha]|uniref:Uncharacterized protein n=1 Tax=Dreissena polymorpha TaxID=45954 RepID=A0A9D4JRA7_DREPO|nr:uncharacterized protein LOC127880987 [Dreissena polymorpha]KAH3817147.1 hypothetical protein DPMN_118676 [Dreissena polymorpha]